MVLTIFPSQCKLYAPSVSRPFNVIFNKCFTEGVFPKAWKFVNVQPIHKNKIVDRLNLIIVLYPSFLYAEFFSLKKIAFDDLYSFMNTKSPISKDQSGVRPGHPTN